MRGFTHFAVGLAVGVGFTLENQPASLIHSLITIGSAGLAAVLPDIDIEKSTINNLLFQKLKSHQRRFALGSIGALFMLGYFVYPQLPSWLCFLGIFFIGAAIAKHRTLTHSLLGLLYVAFVVHLALPTYFWPILFGYASHLLLDACTISGVPLLWPYHYNFSLKQLGISIRTGTTFDHMLGVIAILIVGYELFLLLFR
ncbi:metal-dependent hydrolase [Thermoflavimicrobium daqui]|uniref:Inner membrane protein n=1 Tax=Thermoflavimicrobium daqui TaxID=2137476 RepID=A0A364K4P1_9BACL|nr:metal-dependent hydrolase [Thermoflavimicrobium daqui]RAL24261.1 hypothetical protein DL897_11320 [Thermoflavimicrobium daqui]